MEQKKGNNKILIVIGIIIIFAIVVFAIINIQNKDNNNNGTSILNNKKDELMSKTEHIYGNSQTNINNGGLIVGDNEYIYYADQTGLKYCVKKQNIQTGEKTDLITSNNQINYINIYNDDVYYLTENSIFKISKIGEDRQRVVENVVSFTMVDDYIYYVQKNSSYNGKLCRLKVGETKSKEISSLNVKEFSIYGNTIAFTDSNNFKLSIVDLDGKNEKRICEDKVKNITRYDDYVFFNDSTTGTFCRIKIDGTSLKDIMSNTQNKYLIQDNQIIIPNFSFVFYDLDGKELKKYRNEESSIMYDNTTFVDLGIANNIIYYNKTSMSSTGIELISITN